MKPQKLAEKSAAPAFPLKFRVGESGFDSDTLMKILSGAGVTTFFPKSTTSGAGSNPIIKSGCSRSNVPSPVAIDKNNNTHRKQVKPVEEGVYSKRATLFRISPEDGKWKDQGFGNIQILRNSSSGTKRYSHF